MVPVCNLANSVLLLNGYVVVVVVVMLQRCHYWWFCVLFVSHRCGWEVSMRLWWQRRLLTSDYRPHWSSRSHRMQLKASAFCIVARFCIAIWSRAMCCWCRVTSQRPSTPKSLTLVQGSPIQLIVIVIFFHFCFVFVETAFIVVERWRNEWRWHIALALVDLHTWRPRSSRFSHTAFSPTSTRLAWRSTYSSLTRSRTPISHHIGTSFKPSLATSVHRSLKSNYCCIRVFFLKTLTQRLYRFWMVTE